MALLILLLIIELSTGTPEERVIQASELESIIRGGGPAEFDDRTILGDLNLSGLVIKQPVHFNSTIFKNSVTFNSTTFKGDAYFRSSTYNGDTIFRNSTYNGTADFWCSTSMTCLLLVLGYNDDADFGGRPTTVCQLRGSTCWHAYSSTRPTTACHFGGSTYNDDVPTLGDSKPNSFCRLRGSTHNGTAYWGSTTTYFPRLLVLDLQHLRRLLSTTTRCRLWGFPTTTVPPALRGLTYNGIAYEILDLQPYAYCST